MKHRLSYSLNLKMYCTDCSALLLGEKDKDMNTNNDTHLCTVNVNCFVFLLFVFPRADFKKYVAQ